MSTSTTLTPEQEARVNALLEKLPELEERTNALSLAGDLRDRAKSEFQLMDEALEEVQIDRTEMRRALYNQQSDTLAAMGKLQMCLEAMRNAVGRSVTDSACMSKHEEEELTGICKEMQSILDAVASETKERQQKIVFRYDSIAEFLHDKTLTKQQKKEVGTEPTAEEKEEEQRIEKLTMMANVIKHLKTHGFRKEEEEEVEINE